MTTPKRLTKRVPRKFGPAGRAFRCPNCLIGEQRIRIAILSNGSYIVSYACNRCQEKANKAIQHMRLIAKLAGH